MRGGRRHHLVKGDRDFRHGPGGNADDVRRRGRRCEGRAAFHERDSVSVACSEAEIEAKEAQTEDALIFMALIVSIGLEVHLCCCCLSTKLLFLQHYPLVLD